MAEPPKETEVGPKKVLQIVNRDPNGIAASMEANMIPDSHHEECRIGYVIPNQTQPDSFLTGIETNVCSGMGDNDNYISQLKKDKQYGVRTSIGINNRLFFGPQETQALMDALSRSGAGVRLITFDNGQRKIQIDPPKGKFALLIGWETPQAQLKYYEKELEDTQKESPEAQYLISLARADVEKSREEISTFVPDLYVRNQKFDNEYASSSYLPYVDRYGLLSQLEEMRNVSEAVTEAIYQAFNPGTQIAQTMRMDWLPPEMVEEMTARERESSALEIPLERTHLVASEAAESTGLERLFGCPEATITEVKRITERLKDPRRADFMKRAGFKMANGAVFYGPSGTGKSVAGEAIAQEAGCQYTLLKLDQYLTAYIHESAQRLGKKLSALKQDAAGLNKMLVVQIDEADQILKPVDGRGGISASDADEVRGVLLREFQEPSNVFFIMTTNLDPRNPRQCDPAIVRSERIADLVLFLPPDEKGRGVILEKEIGKRKNISGLSWEGVDAGQLATQTEGFSPANLMEILSRAALKSFDPDKNQAVITQQALLAEVEAIKQKIIAERKSRDIGFLVGRAPENTGK